MDTCVSMAEHLCCSLETTRTLLTGYTPIQNTKFHVKKKKKSLLSMFLSFTSNFYLLLATSLVLSPGGARERDQQYCKSFLFFIKNLKLTKKNATLFAFLAIKGRHYRARVFF